MEEDGVPAMAPMMARKGYTRKPRAKYVHAGYGPDGIPLAVEPIMMPPRFGPSRAPSVRQLAARANILNATAEWRAFAAARKGTMTRDQMVAEWRQTHPKRESRFPPFSTKGREHFRYQRLYEQARSRGLTPVWHSSQGMKPGMGVSPRTGRRYPLQMRSLMIQGRPYGSVWQEGQELHGSGRVYG
jgi:hypothetical protein